MANEQPVGESEDSGDARQSGAARTPSQGRRTPCRSVTREHAHAKGRRGREGCQNTFGAGSKARESLRVVSFDSVGHKKYAIQIQRASNGNPCLRIVEGTPQDDGSFRKFDVTVWSEDFASFFRAMDEIRQFMRDHDVRTPKGHVWKPRTSAAMRTSRNR